MIRRRALLALPVALPVAAVAAQVPAASLQDRALTFGAEVQREGLVVGGLVRTAGGTSRAALTIGEAVPEMFVPEKIGHRILSAADIDLCKVRSIEAELHRLWGGRPHLGERQ